MAAHAVGTRQLTRGASFMAPTVSSGSASRQFAGDERQQTHDERSSCRPERGSRRPERSEGPVFERWSRIYGSGFFTRPAEPAAESDGSFFRDSLTMVPVPIRITTVSAESWKTIGSSLQISTET